MALKDKLKELLEEKNMKPAELARNADISEAMLSYYLSGKREPMGKTCIKIAGALGVSLDELLETPAGERDQRIRLVNERSDAINKLSPSAHRIARAYDIAPAPTQRIVDVTLEPYMDKAPPPRLKLSEPDMEASEPLAFSIDRTRLSLPLPMQSLSAGPGEYINSDYTVMAMVTLDISARKADYLMRITGDSMEPDYANGCIVAVEAVEDIELGEVGVFSINGDHYLKEKGRQGLISINPKYPVIKINEDDDFRCHGRVVGIAEDIEFIEE